MKKKIEIIGYVEKWTNGSFLIYSDTVIGNNQISGYGNTEEKAKKDFVRSIKDAIAKDDDELTVIKSLDDVDITYSME